MQILYILSALSVLMTMGYNQFEAVGSSSRDNAMIVAEQMSIWHQAALNQCTNSICPSGAIDPVNSLPSIVVDGLRRKFISRFDATSGILATQIMKDARFKGDPPLRSILSSLNSGRQVYGQSIGYSGSSGEPVAFAYISKEFQQFNLDFARQQLDSVVKENGPLIVSVIATGN